MKDLKNLLEKFQNLGLKEHKIKDSLIEILKEDLNIKLTRNHFDLKDNKIILKIAGPVKTSIILKKSFYLEKVNTKIESSGLKVLDIN